MIYSLYIKGSLDKIMAFSLIILLLPIFILIYLLLLITQGRQVFFIQVRSGKGLITFKLLKFRTLKSTSEPGLSLNNRQFTYFGKSLRRLGIDEWPQLYNILMGEMSFIGPRPMPQEYEKMYNDHHLQRFNVNPGLTGWAQIHGKNNISWGKRFDLDAWYVENMTFLTDVKIFWQTIILMFNALLILGKEETEMPVFNGSNLS